jgi:hypothetical protein
VIVCSGAKQVLGDRLTPFATDYTDSLRAIFTDTASTWGNYNDNKIAVAVAVPPEKQL